MKRNIWPNLYQTYFNQDKHWQGLEVAHHIVFGAYLILYSPAEYPIFHLQFQLVLGFLRLDTPLVMIKTPRLLQSVFATVGDLYSYKLFAVLFGDNVAKWVVFFQLTNWFMIYCFIRTLSNSLKKILTLISLCFWPCMRSSKSFTVSRKWNLVLAALACAIRLTSAIIWLYVGLLKFSKERYKLKLFFLEVTPIGFVFSILPIVLIFSSYYCLATIEDPVLPGYKVKESLKKFSNCSPKMILAIIFLLVANIPMSLYMSLVHQRGPEDVMNHLAREARHGKVKNILFLIPCHATPYYSILHCDLPMRFLDWTPSEESGVLDESDYFFMDPVLFLSEYAKNMSLPSHIILFDLEEQKLKNLLNSYDYREVIIRIL